VSFFSALSAITFITLRAVSWAVAIFKAPKKMAVINRYFIGNILDYKKWLILLAPAVD
jgi:hypothetical protein